MKRVTKISELEIGQEIVCFDNKCNITICEYLMINPHNNKYALILDRTTQNATSVLDEAEREYFTDVTTLDILAYRLDYYQKKVKKTKLDIENELSKQKGE